MLSVVWGVGGSSLLLFQKSCKEVTTVSWREKPELLSLKQLLRKVKFMAWPEGGSTLRLSPQSSWQSGVSGSRRHRVKPTVGSGIHVCELGD